MSTPLRLKRKQDEPAPPEEPKGDVVLTGHTYDGIKEYDNPMPGWWVWTFWATIVFAVFYVPAVHFWDLIDDYGDNLAAETAALTDVRAAFAAANPSFDVDEASLQAFVDDESAVLAGATVYAASCAACHGNAGQGLIGPNLADAYWVHGGSNVAIYSVITEGVLAKGMPGWEASLTAEQRAQLVAYIRSLEGTDPPGAKAPEGDLYAPDAPDS